jgi:hypothetical protein
MDDLRSDGGKEKEIVGLKVMLISRGDRNMHGFDRRRRLPGLAMEARTSTRRFGPRPVPLIALLLAAGLVSGCSCGKKQTPGPGSAGAGAQKPGYECLTTPNGIPRKVIVKTEGAYAFERPDFTGPSRPLAFFRKYFVFKEQVGRGFLVGEATTRESALGWVRQADVIPWNHEQAVYFINKQAQGAAPVKVWMDKRDIGRYDAPYFEENLMTKETTEPFPILQKEGSAVRVAFLWNKPASLQSVPINREQLRGTDFLQGKQVGRDNTGSRTVRGDSGATLAVMQRELRRMDIVLVIDVTSSMGPYMAAVLQKMTRIVDQLSNMGSADFPVESYIGVVAFRDYPDARDSFITKQLDLTTDRQRVHQFLADLKPFSRGEGKYEAVFEGVADGIQRMSWGRSGYRVLVLVGDAPPHKTLDAGTRQAMREGIQVDSPFFAKDFSENVATLQNMMDANSIQFYALGVGRDPEMEDAFSTIANRARRGFFSTLSDPDEFIARLDTELRRQRGEQAKTGVAAASALRKIQQNPEAGASNLNQDEIESLVARNLSPETLTQLAQNRIQTGWFDADAIMNRVSVCVYLRRRDLEETELKLRVQLRDTQFTGQELEVLKSILAPHVGGESLRNVHNVNDLMRMVKDLAVPPDVMTQILRQLDQSDVTKNLRMKLNNIMILTLEDRLFNNYEEGWIPIEYLPGSLSRQ